MTGNVTYQDSRLLFRTLLANGSFSLLSGFAMLAFSGPIARLIGIADSRWLLGIGIGLLGFGGSLLVHAYRKRVRRAEAIAISLMDLGWVIGSIVLVLAAPELFSSAGVVAVLAVAAIVFVFFELQAYALWKLRAV